MNRRDFLKIMGMAAAAGGLPVLVTYSEKNKLGRFVRGKLHPAQVRDMEIGRYESFRFIVSPPTIGAIAQEPPRGVNAFIHRRGGHYGF